VHPARSAGLACLIAMVAAVPALAQSEAAEEDLRSAEQVVRDVYHVVSWTDGNTPDWEVVGEVFIPEAIVVLRYPPNLSA